MRIKKSEKNTILRFLLIFVCFTLTSCGYLTWLYHLTDIISAPDPDSIDYYTMVIGYLFQAAGIGIFSAVIRRYPNLLGHTTFMISCILYILFLLPSMLSDQIGISLSCGFLANLFCGIIAGYYIYVLTLESDRLSRARLFGFAYGLSTIILWFSTLKWNYLYSVYSLFLYAFLAIIATCLYFYIPEAKESPRIQKQDDVGSSAGSDIQPTSSGRFQTIMLAAAGVILFSLVKNLGFAFPTSDILSGMNLEFSRVFYGTGLILAGFINDQSRRIGSILCLSSLVFPFVMLVLSGELVSAVILWSLNYFFFGFFSVFRVILFSDISEQNDLFWISALGLFFGRIGDAAGTGICSGLNGNLRLLVIAAATLFILAVFVFFQLYQQLYALSSPLPQATSVPDKQERFEQFCIHFGCSRRERDVLRCIFDEQSNSEIADKLFISESTVKFHIHNLLKKTGCKNRVELLALYYSDHMQGPV